MSNSWKRGRKLTQGQKRRHRMQVEKAVQQALLEHEQNQAAPINSKPLTPQEAESVKRAVANIPPDFLKAAIAKEMRYGHIPQPLTVAAKAEVNSHAGLVVDNWKHGWKWVSNWALAGIAYISIFGVPPELISALPEASQAKVTLALSIIGFIGRFINQSRQGKELPSDSPA